MDPLPRPSAIGSPQRVGDPGERATYTRSSTIAMPWPTPMHIVVSA
jgi:hypothetical protein